MDTVAGRRNAVLTPSAGIQTVRKFLVFQTDVPVTRDNQAQGAVPLMTRHRNSRQ